MEEVHKDLQNVISVNAAEVFVPGFSIYAAQPPWTYWNVDLVLRVKSVLEARRDSSLRALTESPHLLETAFRVILDDSWKSVSEKTIVLSKPEDLRTFATVILPEYLRLAEHAYVNLLRFLWKVMGRKRFNTAAALQQLPREFSDSVLFGYDDRLRNGIAHGEIRYGVFEITYGDRDGEITADATDILCLLDNLWSTCNSLGLGILLFLSESLSSDSERFTLLPPSIMTFLMRGQRDRRCLVVETSLVHSSGTDQELNVYVKCCKMTDSLLKHEALKIAHDAFLVSGWRYHSVLIAFDTGIRVPSLIRIVAEPFKSLLDSGVELTNLEEAMPLAHVWKPLHPLFSKWELYSNIFYARNYSDKFMKHRLRIRSVENVSIGLTARVRITAVVKRRYIGLPSSEFFEDIAALSHELGNKPILVGSPLEGRMRFFRKPSYVWVDLYREDCSLRQIGRGGWYGDNLMLTSEFRKGIFSRAIMPGAQKVRVKRVDIVFAPPFDRAE